MTHGFEKSLRDETYDEAKAAMRRISSDIDAKTQILPVDQLFFFLFSCDVELVLTSLSAIEIPVVFGRFCVSASISLLICRIAALASL